MSGRKYDVITSRAFASLKDMVALTRSLLSDNGRWLAMKGKLPEEEIKDLPNDVEVEKQVRLTLGRGEIDRVLIVLKRKDCGEV